MSFITTDSIQFTAASPEMSILFVGPSIFSLSFDPDRLLEMGVHIKMLLKEQKDSTQTPSEGKSTLSKIIKLVNTVVKNLKTVQPFSYLSLVSDIQVSSANTVIPITGNGMSVKAFISSISGAQHNIRFTSLMNAGPNILTRLLMNDLHVKLFNDYNFDDYIDNINDIITNLPFGLGIINISRTSEICSASYYEGCRIDQKETNIRIQEVSTGDNVVIKAADLKTLNPTDVKNILKIIE